LVTPQSLLGERFVECKTTNPRAPGTEPPPELQEVPEGETGAGQRFLPVEQNGKSVDLDLVNNIMRQPYVDRFRLILNDLGAGVAGRAEDLDEIIQRADPALRQTNEVLAILARQRRALDSLASNGDRILAPLARERDHISGFINNAETAAAATAERRADLEAQLVRLPRFVRELRLTMAELDRFNAQAEPVISDFGDAAPSLTRVNTALEPFSDAGTQALRSLGDAADEAGPDLVAADPILIDLRQLAEDTRPLAKSLAELLSSLRETGGFEFLAEAIFNLSGSVNAFDSYGHFLRTLLPLNNCVDYEEIPENSCESFFTEGGTLSAPAKRDDGKDEKRELDSAQALESLIEPPPGEEAPAVPPVEPPAEPGDSSEPPADGETQATEEDAKLYLDYLFGEPRDDKSGKRRSKR
jgi:ABC-type transporter Mla subunit MlaD